MRTCLIALSTAFLFALSCQADAQTLPSLEIIPAWQGLFHFDKNTELKILIHPGQNGPALLTITGGSINKQLQLQLLAGNSKELFIPLRLTDNNAIKILFERPGLPGKEKTVWFDLASNNNKVVALAIDHPPAIDTDDTLILNSNAGMLPRHSQAYDMIDALVIDAATLSSLNDSQLKALESFLSVCGQLITVNMPKEVLAALIKNAGCHGNKITVVDNYNQIRYALTNLSRQMPGIQTDQEKFKQLARGSFPKNRIIETIIVFFIFYLLALLLTRLLTRRAEAMLAVSVAGSLLTGLAWSGSDPEINTFTWIEQNSGEASARYAMFFQHIGNGPGQTRITSPAKLQDPVTINSNTLIPTLFTSKENGVTELVLPTALLNQTELYFNGSIPYDSRISLLNNNGIAQVINHGSQAVENAFLLWEEKIIKLPAIQAQTAWSNTALQSKNLPAAVAEISPMLDLSGPNYRHALIIKQAPRLLDTVAQDKPQPGWQVIHAELG